MPEGLEAGEFDAALGYAGGWEFEGGFVLSFYAPDWGLERDGELIASLAPPEGALRDAGPLTDRQLEYPAYAGLYTDAEGAEYQTVCLARQMESVAFMLGLDAARYGRDDAVSFASASASRAARGMRRMTSAIPAVLGAGIRPRRRARADGRTFEPRGRSLRRPARAGADSGRGPRRSRRWPRRRTGRP